MSKAETQEQAEQMLGLSQILESSHQANQEGQKQLQAVAWVYAETQEELAERQAKLSKLLESLMIANIEVDFLKGMSQVQKQRHEAAMDFVRKQAASIDEFESLIAAVENSEQEATESVSKQQLAEKLLNADQMQQTAEADKDKAVAAMHESVRLQQEEANLKQAKVRHSENTCSTLTRMLCFSGKESIRQGCQVGFRCDGNTAEGHGCGCRALE